MSRALMLRKLLACLALLTGLAAAGTPVQAVAAVTLASSVETGLANPTVRQGAVPTTATAPVRSSNTVRQVPVRKASGGFLRFPSVYLGSDRARE